MRKPQSEFEGVDNTVEIEYDCLSRKTELVGGPDTIAIMFDEKSFTTTILGFAPQWDYKHCIEDISQKIIKLSTIEKKKIKCDIIHGSLVNSFRQPIPFNFFR